MVVVHLYQACGCLAVCEVPDADATDDIRELNGWFTCSHNEDKERGMKTFEFIGWRYRTGIRVYKESSSGLVQ